MGVAIHFEGQLKSADSFSRVVMITQEFARDNGMNYQIIEEHYKYLQRVKDEKEWDYEGPVQGIKIQPDINSDPLWIEFDKDFYIQDFCKTQFAGLTTHIKVVELLGLIKPYFSMLKVEDEGEYWKTNDSTILQEHFNRFFEAFEKAKQENSKLNGPYRLANERIVDLLEND
jgi:hypothetical protein